MLHELVPARSCNGADSDAAPKQQRGFAAGIGLLAGLWPFMNGRAIPTPREVVCRTGKFLKRLVVELLKLSTHKGTNTFDAPVACWFHRAATLLFSLLCEARITYGRNRVVCSALQQGMPDALLGRRRSGPEARPSR